VPSLPPINDLSLIIELWTNTDGLKRDRPHPKSTKGLKNGKRPNKADHWGTLEVKGDGYAKHLAVEELPKIIGPENHKLLRVLIEHSVSNAFFAQISRDYKLNKWVMCSPRDEKQWANIFEVFIACVALNRQLLDPLNYLVDVRVFLSQLWSIRYRKLSKYFMPPLFDIPDLSEIYLHPNVNVVNVEQIDFPTDPIFSSVLGSLVNSEKSPTPRVIGWLATVTISKHDQAECTFSYPGFSSVDETNAIEIAKLRCSILNCTSQCNTSVNPEQVHDRAPDQIFTMIKQLVEEVSADERKNSGFPKRLAEKLQIYLDDNFKSDSDTESVAMRHWQKVICPIRFFPKSSLFLSSL
jgi:hypothetical protein